MRKIEKQIIEAIKARKTVRLSARDLVRVENVSENPDCKRVIYSLWGHDIFRALVEDDGSVYGMSFTLSGYPTVTTRSRLNALLGAFYGACARVYQKNYAQHWAIDDTQVDENTWYFVKNDGTLAKQ
jgi:hypothetical protein